MRVFITGGSGLIGRALMRRLLQGGHDPVILSRNPNMLRRDREFRDVQVVEGDPSKEGRWQDDVDGAEAVVNLVGHNVFAERWSDEVKRKIRDSRVYSTQHVVEAIRKARRRPEVLVQASAVGYYGPHDDEDLDESSLSGRDFLAVVCREWEDAAAGVAELGVRLATIRTGIVLAPHEGALAIMTPLFKLGPGMPIGSSDGFLGRGRQWMSWIHLDDIVGLFDFALMNSQVSGPLNGVAPDPVRNADFARAFSTRLWKPYAPWRFYLPFGPPDALLRLVLGEVAHAIISGQKALPKRPLGLGYRFIFPELGPALDDVLNGKPDTAHPVTSLAQQPSEARHTRQH